MADSMEAGGQAMDTGCPDFAAKATPTSIVLESTEKKELDTTEHRHALVKALTVCLGGALGDISISRAEESEARADRRNTMVVWTSGEVHEHLARAAMGWMNEEARAALITASGGQVKQLTVSTDPDAAHWTMAMGPEGTREVTFVVYSDDYETPQELFAWEDESEDEEKAAPMEALRGAKAMAYKTVVKIILRRLGRGFPTRSAEEQDACVVAIEQGPPARPRERRRRQGGRWRGRWRCTNARDCGSMGSAIVSAPGATQKAV